MENERRIYFWSGYMVHRIRAWTAVLVAVGLMGCATAEKKPAEGAPSEDLTNVNDIVPRLHAGLLIRMNVLVSGKAEIEEQAKRITSSGEVTLPLIGMMKVEGMTLEELSRELTKRYEEYFVRPQVVVEFSQDEQSDVVSPWGYVTVLGRVKNPGRVKIPPTRNLTVSMAIQQAGGLDTSAKDSAIRVTREGSDGKREQFDVNLRALGSKGRLGTDVLLQPGDLVFVPEMIF